MEIRSCDQLAANLAEPPTAALGSESRNKRVKAPFKPKSSHSISTTASTG